MKIIHKLKDENEKALGNYKANFDGTNQRIEVFLSLAMYKTQTVWGMDNWNDVYSHIVSHETLHKVIQDVAGRMATVQFDNIAGKVSYDVGQVRTGMNEHRDILSKCETTNKGLNSRNDK